MNVFETVGGEPFFVELVEKFYRGVEQDPLLRPMYPEEDLTDFHRPPSFRNLEKYFNHMVHRFSFMYHDHIKPFLDPPGVIQ